MFFVSGQRVIIIFSEKTKLLIAKNVILCLIGKPRRPRGLFPLHLQSISNEDSKRQLFHEKKKPINLLRRAKITRFVSDELKQSSWEIGM